MTHTVTNPAVRDDLPPIVESSIENLRNIATLPVVAIKILDLTKDPKSNVDDFRAFHE